MCCSGWRRVLLVLAVLCAALAAAAASRRNEEDAANEVTSVEDDDGHALFFPLRKEEQEGEKKRRRKLYFRMKTGDGGGGSKEEWRSSSSSSDSETLDVALEEEGPVAAGKGRILDFDMHSEGNAGKEKRGAGRGISARKKKKCFYSWVFFHENDLGMTKTVESAEECQGYCQQVESCTRWSWIEKGYCVYGVICTAHGRRKVHDCSLKGPGKAPGHPFWSGWERGYGTVSGPKNCYDDLGE